MKRTISVWLLLLVCGFVVAQQAPKGSMEGTVTVFGSGQPLPDARVTVTLLGPDGNPVRGNPPNPTVSVSAMTGSAGEYALKDLEAGSYRLFVLANGFARAEYGPILTLDAGEALRQIHVRMRPAGTVSGRALDTSGRPAVGATVTLLRREYSPAGGMGFNQVASAKTNDLGEYRIYWVTPGRYVVRAEGSGSLIAESASQFLGQTERGNNLVGETYTRTYFPGVDDESQAIMIDVEGNAEVRGVDFTLAPARRYGIRGQIIDAVTGQHPAEATVILGQENGGASSAGSWYDRNTGTMRIDNLTPGKYVVAASARSVGFQLSLLAPSVARASANVVIRDADVQLQLTLAVPPLITGKIRVAGDLPAPAAGNLRVSLTRADGSSLSSILFGSSATSAEDGAFSLAGMPDGEFRVAIRNLPNDLFLKEARWQGSDVLNNVASFSAAGELDLLIAKGSRLEGMVRGQQNRSAAMIQTVLVPEEHRDRPDLFKRTLTDRNGRFSMTGIAPGTYKLFAWEDLEAYSYFDPEVLREYEAQGKPVHVAESSEQTVEVDVIPSGAPR